MLVRSINQKYYYFIIANPFKQIGRMLSKSSCAGCTHFNDEYDKLERKYNHYCNLFGVWQNSKIPNDICLNVRRESECLFSPPEPVIHSRDAGIL